MSRFSVLKSQKAFTEDKTWHNAINLGFATPTYKRRVDWLLVWKDKLWMALGKGLAGEGECVILSYNIDVNKLTVEFEIPNYPEYTLKPVWRVLHVFKDSLFAGLGNRQSANNTGDIYKYDGSTWIRVLDTTERNIYCMETYKGKIYAGGGTNGIAAGKLWSSSDGNTWNLVKTFTEEQVRSLKVWRGKLWIGTRQSGKLYSYDGENFVDHGQPASGTGQVKTLTVYRDRLYLGCVTARIFSYDGSTFTLEKDVSNVDSEVYHLIVYNGGLYACTNGQGTGGRVWYYDGNTWNLDHVDNSTTGQYMAMCEYAGYLWLAGAAIANHTHWVRRMRRKSKVNIDDWFISYIDKSNKIDIKNFDPDPTVNSLQLDTDQTKPVCNASTRGKIWITKGDVGVADKIEVCTKNADGSYSWKLLA